MDHIYIDRERIPEHYVAGELAPDVRRAFEAHLVDCAECSDRLLLAQMFHARNGHAPHQTTPEIVTSPEIVLETPPAHTRFAEGFHPWQYALVLGAATILLLAVAAMIYCWEIGTY